MVHLLMMSTEPSRQQQQEQKQQQPKPKQQQQQQQKPKLKLKQRRKCGNQNPNSGGADASGGVGTSRKYSLNFERNSVGGGGGALWSCRGSGTGAGVGVATGGGGICLWFVLAVFMLILCGNAAFSQQPQRNIKPSYNHNNNGNQNNNSSSNRSANILLQISTPSNNNGGAVAAAAAAAVARAEDDVVGVEKPLSSDSAQKQQPNIIKSIATTTTSSSAVTSIGGKSNVSPTNNASLAGVDGESGHNGKSRGRSKGTPTNVGVGNAKTNTKAATADDDDNDGDNDDDDDDDLDADDDLDNSSELLNESEDGYEHSSISPTTYRPTQRPSVTPQLTSAQKRERHLMNVLTARRNALHRPGFRNRIGTTGRTATAVETTSKSPTDPRSICIRNCTKNFTRRTTASCMRQCANFSRVANQANLGGVGSVVMVKMSSKSGAGTALAGEKDTNEILFTDESSHGVLVIAKEQNDTVNHINDAVKGVGLTSKLRNRRKPGPTVTVAKASIEDDEIQPYLYFGQKLPPLKPNALTITSVSDEHPKLLEVSVAEDTTPTATTPVSVRSTLSAVERSRSQYKYSTRGGLIINRRYTTLHRGTTPEVPTDVRTTTLRIVTDQPKVREVKSKTEALAETSIKMVDVVPLAAMPSAALREETVATATPLIITVLSDEEMVSPTTDMPTTETSLAATTSTSATSTSTSTSTTTTSTSTTTSTTTASPPTTTTTVRTPAATTTPAPRKYPDYMSKRQTTTTTTTSTTTSTPTPSTTSSTTTAPRTTTTSTSSPTPRTTTTTTTVIPTTKATTTTKQPTVIEEDTELLRALGPSLVNTDDSTNIIIFVNHTSTTTIKPVVTTEARPSPLTKDTNSTTTQLGASLPGVSTTSQPQVTGEISSTVVTDDQEISLEMQRMNIVTMVLAGIGIVPLLAIILYLLRNYLLKRPIKDDEDFDVCITDQQPISPVKKLDAKYQEDDQDEVDHHKKQAPQRQHSLHSKLVSAPLARDNNHNYVLGQQRYDDKSSITSDQEFDRSNIRLKSLLGEGNFGQVWKAEADDLSGHFGATRIVAVKTIKACSTQLSLKDEGNIMRKLGSHQNVVTLLGACVETEPHMLIMEYAMRGRLLSLLRAARNATNILPASVPGGRSLAPLSPRTLAGFCLDISRGMEYIADKRVVHRDLAARNVLLDHNGVCKICDFGMSIDLDAERKRKELEKNCANEIMRSNFNKFKFDFGGKFIMNHWSTGSPQKDGCSEKKSHGHDTIGKRPALPIRWMAPESLQYNVFSMETDLWAFGIVLWEIATLGSTPYSHLTGREVIRRVPQGLRPDLPKEGRHEFYNLMSRCWHKDPQMRPSFSQCRLEITRSLHKWVDDDSAASDYMDVSGFSEDLEQGMVYFNHRISEFECEI